MEKKTLLRAEEMQDSIKLFERTMFHKQYRKPDLYIGIELEFPIVESSRWRLILNKGAD